ncbi:ureidoglycolate lyase [Aromatoleum toluolicum]|uniref:Ureidoglycolate lyase n=1 Tax=Aromatoleum toluolicum TaxID=90060 RepID=A0ABX1NKK5_9RHOO|nr:ureidoglycolate lyase [Aromatoleum toluolicum]NMF99590.1 ureidoglycolate lyase [Aromatoleum toluolicum]
MNALPLRADVPEPRHVVAEALTPEAFAPFGDVIAARDDVRRFAINGGNTMRYHDLAKIDPGPDGHAIVSIFRGEPRTLPFPVEMMERHPLGSQAFVPMSGRPYLVVVAPAGDPPAAEDLRVFLARGDQGINYARGVWHHPLLALDAVCDFVVIDRAGNGHNCDEITLDEVVLIEPPR